LLLYVRTSWNMIFWVWQ